MASDGVAGGEPLSEGEGAGWIAWSDPEPDTFHVAIGGARGRVLGPAKALVALATRRDHRNRLGALHGGFLAAFADHAFFVGLSAMGHRAHMEGVTVDLSMQYLGAGVVGPDLMAEVEILRETGRLYFLRMVISQDGNPVAASTATIRKGSSRK
ncbi:PaaI family thioesterase [Sphingobium amiense]|uniref:PaaI family thioesterase n=1 Tax=Sphingobium amiense TaxID=135719 RepID=A0A494VWR4_9SPHN|nr:PaaI family thioesterase [Sphingobium amiense]BBD96854.1 PaaI family thioesterase [Sphingobium amiense]